VDAAAPIRVTHHAAKRLLERDSRIVPPPQGNPIAVVLRDVGTALREGRTGRHWPAEFRSGRERGDGKKPNGIIDPKKEIDGITRYAWTPELDRAYVLSWVKPRRSGRTGRIWLVLTVKVAPDFRPSR
jgi:hypothetical protein